MGLPLPLVLSEKGSTQTAALDRSIEHARVHGHTQPEPRPPVSSHHLNSKVQSRN